GCERGARAGETPFGRFHGRVQAFSHFGDARVFEVPPPENIPVARWKKVERLDDDLAKLLRDQSVERSGGARRDEALLELAVSRRDELDRAPSQVIDDLSRRDPKEPGREQGVTAIRRKPTQPRKQRLRHDLFGELPVASEPPEDLAPERVEDAFEQRVGRAALATNHRRRQRSVLIESRHGVGGLGEISSFDRSLRMRARSRRRSRAGEEVIEDRRLDDDSLLVPSLLANPFRAAVNADENAP